MNNVFKTCALTLLVAPTLLGMQRQGSRESSRDNSPRQHDSSQSNSSHSSNASSRSSSPRGKRSHEDAVQAIQVFMQLAQAVQDSVRSHNHVHVVFNGQQHTMFFDRPYQVDHILAPSTVFQDQHKNIYRIEKLDEQSILILVDSTDGFKNVLPISLHPGHTCTRSDASTSSGSATQADQLVLLMQAMQAQAVQDSVRPYNHVHVVFNGQQHAMFFDRPYPSDHIFAPSTVFQDEHMNIYRIEALDEQSILILVDSTDGFKNVLPISLHPGHTCTRSDASTSSGSATQADQANEEDNGARGCTIQ